MRTPYTLRVSSPYTRNKNPTLRPHIINDIFTNTSVTDYFRTYINIIFKFASVFLKNGKRYENNLNGNPEESL